MVATLLVTRSTSLFNDVDGDGAFDPGDVLLHTIIVTNQSGVENALNVVINDDVNGATPTGTINISPIAFNDSFTAVGNTMLLVGGATHPSSGPSTSVSGNLLANDVDFLGDSFIIDVVVGGVSANGGTFNINADGSFSYINQAGHTGTDTFTYTIRDDGFDGIYGNADDLLSTATVTITLQGEVWYVDSTNGSDATGDGTSANPFATLTHLNNAGSDVDGANDYIYVQGNVTGSITLEAGQQLIGTGSALTVEGFNIATAGANSTVTATAGFGVTLGTGNTVAGLNLAGTGGVTGTSFGTATLSNLTANTSGQAVALATGTVAGTGFTSTTSSGGSSNVSLNAVDGTLNLGSGALSGATVGAGISVVGGNVGVTYSGTIGQANNASTVLVTGGHSGSLNLSGNITATNGAGLQFNNADGTYTMSGVISLTGTGEAGIDILNGSSGTFTFGTAANTATITNNSGGDAFVMSNSNANVTFNGTITDNNGNAVNMNANTGGTVTFQNGSINSTGSGIDVTNATGGTVNFNNQVTLNTGTTNAVNLTNNSGATINFNTTGNGLDITTTSGNGFHATGGGTVSVTGSGNTISTGSGSAINVQNTNIGANDLTFTTVSSSGGGTASAIILVNTGSAGGFHLLGNGTTQGASGGGVIGGRTDNGADGNGLFGSAIYLNNTAEVELNGLTINGTFENNGLLGYSVNGIRLTNSTFSGSFGDNVAGNESAIAFGNSNPSGANGLSGNSLIDNVNVSGGIEHNIEIYQQSGSFGLTIRNSNIHHNSVGSGSDGILIEMQGTAAGTIAIQNNQFSDNKSQAIQGAANDSSTLNLTVSGNTITRGTQGNEGVVLSNGGNGHLNTTVSNNTISGFGGVGIFVGQTPGNATSSSLLQATISGNTVTSPVDATNHSIIAFLSSTAGHVSQARLSITGNTVTQNSAVGTARGILVDTPDALAGVSPNYHATVSNNVVNTTHIDAPTAIVVAARNTATGHVDVQNNDVNHNGGSTAFGVQVRQATSGTMELMRGPSAGGTAAQVLDDNHTDASTTTTVTGTVTIANNGTILTPAATPLPTVPIMADAPPPPVQTTTPTKTTDGTAGSMNPDTPAAPADNGPIVVDDGVVSQAELDLIVEAAIQRWADAGATPEQIEMMRAVTVTVNDLGGLQLGGSGAGTITIDDNGAGWSWFIDATPNDDSEYAGSGTVLTATSNTSQAGTRVDLLTVMMHELGHQIGLGHDDDAGELMFGSIRAGERRLPGADDAEGATGTPVTGGLALTPVGVGTLPAGQSVTVQFTSTIDPVTNQVITPITQTTTVTGDNVTINPASDTTDTLNLDTLTLGNLVFLDVNKNGIFDGSDTGIAGVALTLFADTDDDGVLSAGDTELATTTTDLNGGYSFANLAPGNYIVRVDASNFGSGQALEGRVTSLIGDADPDDNVDGDDNGVAALGGSVASGAITLDYNSEPTAGTGNDTNNTLDFAFEQPNQAPTSTNLSGDSVTWTEGDSAVLLDLGGNATLADADSANFDGGSLTLAITGGVAAEDVLAIVDQGTGAGQIGVSGSDVTYGGVVIGTFTGGSGGSPLAISFDADATPAAVQALMRNISYSNSGGDDPTDGDRTVTWTLVDGDGTANGGVDTLQFTTTVDVDPVNDEPEGADKDVTILEDGTHTFTTSDFGFSDPLDGGTFSFVKITTLPTAGKLFLDGVEIGAAGGDVFVQDIIDGKLTYQPEADANGTNYASFTFQVGDDGGTANGGVNTDQTPNTFTFDVTAVNDDPAIGNLDGDTVSFTEGDALMSASLDTGLDALVSDVDNVNFDGGSLRVQVTTNAVPGEDFIYFNNSNPAFGLTFSGNTLSYNGVAFATFTAPSEDRTFTFNSNATPQAVQSLVRSLTYFNSNTANPSDATRTVELTLSDGSGGSTTVATSVDVIAVNDAPTGADNTVTTSEDDAYAFTAADFGFADAAEGHELAAVIVTSLPTNGTLVLNGGQITAGHLPLTVPKADIDAGFFVFVPDADEFGTGYASFGFQVQDDGGTANGGDDTSGTYTLTIDVTPDNVAPEVDLNGAGAGVDNTATYTEQAPIVTLAADLTVADDGATLTGATVQITGGFVPLAGDGADYLGIAGSGSGTVGAISYSYSALTGVLTLSGSASVADYQALLRQVSFQSTTNDPGTSRTISWTVTDGSLSSTAVETTITVTPVNDAPVITLADATVSGTEDENVVFNAANGNAITVSDLDNATLTVTLAVANGALTLSQTTGLSFSTGDGTGDSSMTFTGSAADINAALEGLVYRGNLNYEGADTLNVEVTDGALTDTDSIAITLADDGKIDGTPGNDTLVGTPFSDFFDLSQGGSDTANALGGLDVFYMGGALDAGDNLDGGALIDQLALQGDYSGGLTLGANNLTNIEILALLSGSDDRFGDTAGNSYDYNLTLVDANVAAGDRLFIDAAQLGVGEDLIFDGSAETNGSLWFFAGKGTDNLTGGAQSDVFLFRDGGRFTADDRIDGGAGTDQLALRGNYSTQIVMQADTIKNVEAIALLSGNNTHYGPFAGNFSYNLLMHDGNVAAGKTLFVDAAQLRAGESLIFDGSQETNGVFKIWGGLGNDVLIGGAGADTIIGGGGADTMAGNGGNDIFRYFSTSDSAVGAEDTIISFFAGDIIDLSAIDARAHTPQDNAFNFIGSAAFSGSGNGSSGQLRAQNTSGNNWIIEGDTNGDGTADFRINVITADGDPITAVDFIF